MEVEACGVCHTDLHVIKGEVAFPRPAVLGHEVSGHVAEVGDGVLGFEVGDRVVCSFIMPCGTCRHCVAGRDDLCSTFFAKNRLRGTLYDDETRLSTSDGAPVWMYSMGGLAEYCVVPATDVFPVPEDVSLRDVAIVGCSSFTAFGAVNNVGRVAVGERVAVIAAGGVGMSIIQFARLCGAGQVIAVDVDDDKLAAAAAAGATHVINAVTDDVVEHTLALTGGQGVDVAFEALGRPATFSTALDVLGDGGRCVVVGIAPAGSRGDFDLARLVRRKIQILGSYGARARSDMPVLIELVRAGVVQPRDLVTAHYGLDEVELAYRLLAEGRIVGRAVIDMTAASA